MTTHPCPCPDDVDAVQVVVHAEEEVKGKQLAERVDEVEDLDKEVETEEVVAAPVAAQHEARPRKYVLHAQSCAELRQLKAFKISATEMRSLCCYCFRFKLCNSWMRKLTYR